MEDLISVKLSDAERARAKAISRRLASVGLLIFLTIPISLIVSLMLRGKISSFNSTVDSYVMPALHSVSPGLWRFINFGFTTDMRYSAEYLLVAWVTSGVLGLVAGAIVISAIRQMDLNYFIFNAQERSKPIKGLGFEFLLVLGGLGFAAFLLFIMHEVDFVSLRQPAGERDDSLSPPTPLGHLHGPRLQPGPTAGSGQDNLSRLKQQRSHHGIAAQRDPADPAAFS